MRIYTVHVKPGPDGDLTADNQAQAVFVPEGFSFWAFLLQPVWALYHRLWLVAIGIFAAIVLLGVIVTALGLSGLQSFCLQILFAIAVGVLAQDFRRWTLDRRGYTIQAVVAGDALMDAESRYFREMLGVR